jgi:hypothetical protein
MKPDGVGNGQFRRIGHLTEAICVRIESASVDATARTEKSLFVQSVCRKHHYHSGSSLPQLAAGEAIGNRISGSLLPRSIPSFAEGLCGGEGLGE